MYEIIQTCLHYLALSPLLCAINPFLTTMYLAYILWLVPIFRRILRPTQPGNLLDFRLNQLISFLVLLIEKEEEVLSEISTDVRVGIQI